MLLLSCKKVKKKKDFSIVMKECFKTKVNTVTGAPHSD